jgi:hypothetical protein
LTRAAPPPAAISTQVDAAIARDPRLRAVLARLDAGQRDHVRRVIARTIEAKLRERGYSR